MRVKRGILLDGGARQVQRVVHPFRPQFISLAETAERFAGKSVAIVGSGPGALKNETGFIDSHEIIVRVNNYKIRGVKGYGDEQIADILGTRTDVFYSFYGGSIRKDRSELIADGVKLCMAKCPNAKVIESEWHKKHGKERGTDFRWIYARRAQWWFSDVYVPTTEKFLEYFDLLGGHVPTTGFSCILDILSFPIKSLYITGFDFFKSGIHNVDSPWKRMNDDDPIGHVPELEMKMLKSMEKKMPVTYDKTLTKMMRAK